MTTRDSLKLLLILNVIPLVILAGVGIAVWEGRIGVRLPGTATATIGVLCVLATLSAGLGFFAAPAIEGARQRNRQRIDHDLDLLGRRLGFGRRVKTGLRLLWRRFLGAVLTIESAGIHLILLLTLIGIVGVGGLGIWLAWQMVNGQA